MARLEHLLLGFCLGLFATLIPTSLEARQLHWESLEVAARIDKDGLLHVSERQAIVFTGDWNGGERAFDIRAGQRLELERITRFDAETGREVPLRHGELDTVDNYAWYGSETLRWRSRLPSDPVFANTQIVYTLDYTLSGVLSRVGELYRLDHDFAFPDRAGTIETFRLTIELDPAWRVPAGFQTRYEPGPLPPGRGFVVTQELGFTGSKVPPAVLSFLPDGERLLPLLLALLLSTIAGWGFLRHERKQERHLPADAPSSIDRQWLEETVFSLRPEVVGALWDGSVGPAEVSALIARWVQEGRVLSNVRESGSFWKRDVLELELVADRNQFRGYERRLLDRLFFNDSTKTDTDAIRKRYSSIGFSPVSTIRPSLERRIRELPGMGRSIGGPKPVLGCLLLIALAVLLPLEFQQGGESALALFASLILVGLVPTVAAGSLALRYRNKADGLRAAGFWFLFPLLALLALLAAILLAPGRLSAFSALRLSWFGSVAVGIFFLLIATKTFDHARTRESRARISLRKQLGQARRLFARELTRAAPDLDDDWLPYLLALGLDRRTDRWFRSFGTSASETRSLDRRGGTGGSTGGGWTGGGGAFGGAGATAAWTAAAGGIAAGVSRPSSGSGGGSSGGGGGSSGGGGGGGW